MTTRAILWDFDGTLGTRPSHWSGTLVEVVKKHCPEMNISREDMRPFVQSGFPWHTPEQPHTHIQSPDAWWDSLKPVFYRAFTGIGLDSHASSRLADEFRATYLDRECWMLYDDTIPVLSDLAEQGWIHAILSNHVPELPDLVRDLGIGDFFHFVHTSAVTGYEKPHRQAFEQALASLPPEVTVTWMVGDSTSADIAGAETVGIPAILVRREKLDVVHQSDDLCGVMDIVNRLSRLNTEMGV